MPLVPHSRLATCFTLRFLVAAFLPLTLAACTTTVTRMPASSGFSNLVTADESLHAESKDPKALVARGESLLATGQGRLAANLFIRALALDPENKSAGIGLGQAMLVEGKFQSAERIFARILETQPDNLFALTGAAQACRQGGKPEQARGYLNQALSQAPDDPQLLCEQAGLYLDQGNSAAAEPLYRRIVELRPGEAAAYNNLGFNRILLGRYSEAITALNRALTLAPQNQRIKNNLAVAWALGGREEVAYNLFRGGLGEAAAWNNVGFLLAARGEWQGATSSLQRAMDSNPVFYPRASDNLEQVRRLAAGHGQ